MLNKPRDLEKIFQSSDYIKWRNLRNSPDSRFIALLLPRVLARLPYNAEQFPTESFHFVEEINDEQPYYKYGAYCWSNAIYTYGLRLAHAFEKYGWCTAIRGHEGGGKIDNLPLHYFISENGDYDLLCPTEVAITDRREAELSHLGFLPICHYKNTDYAVFFGAQTIQKPIKYDKKEATENSAISSRLPYIMASSRFAHYLKIMARDKIGSFTDMSELENWLNRWIINYVNGNSDSGQELKAKYPLAEAKVKVEPISNRPGSYQAVAWLKPWLQLEELSTSIRLVARIPNINKN